MHATTIAKIEAGTRSVRINEAVAIADLFEVSLDSLLGRKPGAPQRSELTYLLRALRQSSQQAKAALENVHDLLEELPVEFDGAAGPQKLTASWETYLAPASDALWTMAIGADFLLALEEGTPAPSEEVQMELEVPEDEAPS
jgi:hypothetical protein